MRKNKVFVGPSNVAGNAYYIAKALQEVGIKAFSYTDQPHPFGYPTDYKILQFKLKNDFILFKIMLNRFTLKPINTFIKSIYFFYFLFKYDVFFFISTETFFGNYFDLKILKALNKKVAFFFVGCPERDPNDTINLVNNGICARCNNLGKQKYCLCNNRGRKQKKILCIEDYSDFIFSAKNTSSFLLKKNKVFTPFVVSKAANNDSFLNKYDNIKKYIIVHFPSGDDKGSDIVNNAIKNLKNDFNFTYISKRVENKEVYKNLEKAHILIDQFNSGYGLLAIEAMSCGCIVIGRIADWFEKEHPNNPIINTEPVELIEKLQYLMNNPKLMKYVAINSLKYFKKYHTPVAVGNYYKKVLELK